MQWKNLNTVYSTPNNCPRFDHFAEKITRVWVSELIFLCWAITDSHECDLHNVRISPGAEEATINVWPVPIYLHSCVYLLEGHFYEDSCPEKEHEAEYI